MRNAETLARGGYKLSLQFVSGSKSNAVYQNMQLAVALFELLEEPIDGGILGYVAHEPFRARQGKNQIFGFHLEALVLIGYS